MMQWTEAGEAFGFQLSAFGFEIGLEQGSVECGGSTL
jgi:hypothetical protein